MQTMLEASGLNDESPVQDSNLERGSKDSTGKANREVGKVIDGAPHDGAAREIPLSTIKADKRLQARVTLDEGTVTDYLQVATEAAEAGSPWPFPPAVLVGGHLVDGFHRFEVARRLGRSSILAIDHHGSEDEAILAAVRANSTHGLRRSRQDLQRAIDIAQGRWPNLSAREISRRVSCSPQTVLNVRYRTRQLTTNKAPTLDTPPNGFTMTLGSLRPGDLMIQGIDPNEDWTVVERKTEGFQVLRLVRNESLEIHVRTAEQVNLFLDATDPSYAMGVAVQPFLLIAA